MSDRICYELVEQLASGFGALLEQVQELDTKNANLEHLLDRMQKQVWDTDKSPSPALLGMKKHNSSRSGAALCSGDRQHLYQSSDLHHSHDIHNQPLCYHD